MKLFSRHKTAIPLVPPSRQPRQRQPLHDPAEARRRQAFSYYSSRSDSGTNVGRAAPQAERPSSGRLRLKSLVRRAPTIVAGFIILVCVIDQLGLSSQVKIVPLTTAKSQLFLQNTTVYQQAADKLFAGSIGNRNKVTVNVSGISKSLQQKFPEIASVSVTLPLLGHRPVVYIQPSDPAFILKTSNGSYVLDKSGKALASAIQDVRATHLQLPVVTDQSGLQIYTGQSALSADDTTFIRTVIAELKTQGFAVDKITLPAAAREVDVYITGKSYFIKFNMQSNDARQQAGTFAAVAKQLAQQGKTPAHYIDVRIDGRAYYK